MAENAGSVYSEVRLLLEDLKNDVAKVEVNLDKITKASERTSKKSTGYFSNFYNNFKTFVIGAGVFFGIRKLVQGFKEIISVGAEFEQEIANVASVSGDSREELSKLAREAGERTVFSATQAGKAMYFLASAGLKVQDMSKVLAPTLNLAAAAQLEIAEATDMVVNQLKTFRVGMDRAEDFTDTMAKTVSSANTDMRQLGEALSYAGSTASLNKISFKDINALIATMADQGIKGARAGTQLRMGFAKLLKPSSEAKDVLDKYNISLVDLKNKISDPIALFELLKPVMDDSTDALTLLGVRQQNLVNVIQNGLPRFKELREEIENAGGSAEKMAKVQISTLLGSFKLLKSAIEERVIQIANKFIPVLTTMTNIVTGVVRGEEDLNDTTKRLIEKQRRLVAIQDELRDSTKELSTERKALLEIEQDELTIDFLKGLDKLLAKRKELNYQLKVYNGGQSKTVKDLKDINELGKEHLQRWINIRNNLKDHIKLSEEDSKLVRNRVPLFQTRNRLIAAANEEIKKIIDSNTQANSKVRLQQKEYEKINSTLLEMVTISPKLLASIKARDPALAKELETLLEIAKVEEERGNGKGSKKVLQLTEDQISLLEELKQKTEEFDKTEEELALLKIERERNKALDVAGSNQLVIDAVNKYYNTLRDKTAYDFQKEQEEELTKKKQEEWEKRKRFAKIASDSTFNIFSEMYSLQADLAEEGSDKEKKAREKAFKLEKGSRISSLVMSGIESAQKAFNLASSTFPPPAGQIIGGVLAGLIGGKTALAVGRVIAEKPKFKYGGIVPGNRSDGVDSMDIKATPKEMVLDDQQLSNLFDFINNPTQAGNTILQIVSDTGEKLKELIFEKTKSGEMKVHTNGLVYID